jgi:hypothetical protein
MKTIAPTAVMSGKITRKGLRPYWSASRLTATVITALTMAPTVDSSPSDTAV